MEGHRVDTDKLPSRELVYYRTATKFGWTEAETKACSVQLLDMLLGIDDVFTEVENAKRPKK